MKITLITGHEYGLAVAAALASPDNDNEWRAITLSAGLGRRLLGPRFRSMLDIRSPFKAVEEVDDATNLSPEAIALASESDCLLVVGWPRLLSKSLLDMWSDGRTDAVGFHPSPLPIGRGMSPIPRTIIDGLPSSAVTAFMLEPMIDSGPILARASFDIDEKDHSEQVYAKAVRAHVDCARTVISILGARIVHPIPQEGKVIRWAKIQNSDREFTRSMVPAITRLVRAHNYPYPRLNLTHLGEKYDISGVEYRGDKFGYVATSDTKAVDLLGDGEVLLWVNESNDTNQLQRRGYVMSRTLSQDPPEGKFNQRYAGVVLLRGGSVLLQQRDDKPGIINPGGITLFGGGLEGSESFAHAAARELREELEIEVAENALSLLGYVQKIEPDTTTTLCAMFTLEVGKSAELVQHEGAGVYEASVDAAMKNPKVSETCKAALRSLGDSSPGQ